MLKINSTIPKTFTRYCKKNTINAMYNKNMDCALVTGLATNAQLFRLPFWQIEDIGITAFLGAIFLKSVVESFALSKQLNKIRQRAISIKNSNK